METGSQWSISTALRNGARHCFGSYAELHVLVVRVVGRLIPAWLLDWRDDVVQESMLRMMRAVARGGEGQGYSRAYVRRVVYSVIQDAGRRRRRLREVPLLAEQNPGRAPNVEVLDVPRRVRAALETLAPDRRRAVEAYLVGHRPVEIAELFGWSHKRAENLTYRGLADLRRALVSPRATATSPVASLATTAVARQETTPAQSVSSC